MLRCYTVTVDCRSREPSLLPGKKQNKKMWRALKSHRMQCIWYFAYFYITNTTASGWRTIYFYHTIALNKNVLRFNHLVKKQNSPNCHHLVVECGAFLARLFILHIENGNMEWNICVHVCIEGWGDEEVPFLLSMSVKHPTQKKKTSVEKMMRLRPIESECFKQNFIDDSNFFCSHLFIRRHFISSLNSE